MKKISMNAETPAANRFIEAARNIHGTGQEHEESYDRQDPNAVDVWGPAGQLEASAYAPIPHTGTKEAMAGMIGKGLLALGKGAVGAGKLSARGAIMGGKAALQGGKAVGGAGTSFLRKGGVMGAAGMQAPKVQVKNTLSDVGLNSAMGAYDYNKAFK